MVGSCANPECGTPFKYFRDGRVFAFDRGEPDRFEQPQFTALTSNEVEFFWLCGSCARRWTMQWPRHGAPQLVRRTGLAA